MIDWFIFNRITIIKKRNSIQNIKYLITYIKDLFFYQKKIFKWLCFILLGKSCETFKINIVIFIL